MDRLSNSTPFEQGLLYFGPAIAQPNSFDFSPFFELSVLSILPCALLLFIIPFRLYALYKQPRKVSPSVLHGNKLAILALFASLQVAILTLYATDSEVRTPISLAAGTIVLIDAVGLCLLSHVEHVYSTRPSTIINIFLFITLLFDIAYTRSLWIENAPTPIAAVFTCAIAVKLMSAIAEATEKRNILLSQYQTSNPEPTSGIYNRAFFWWLNNLMTIGFRRIIKDDDLFPIEEEMSSVVLVKRFQKVWSTANKARPNVLFWSTLKATRRPLVLCVFPRLCVIGFRYSQPFLLSRTIDFVKSTSDTKSVGWGLTGAFGVVFVGMAIANALYSHMTFRFSTAVRGTLVGMICMKTVELRSSFTDESAAVTLMSTDTETICGGVPNLHEIWAVPIELGLAMWLLYRELGLSFLSPAAIVFISTACVMAISPLVGAAQKRWNEGIQTRVNITTDVFGSIKAVKVLGYTPKVTEILQDLRVNELKLSSMFRRLLCATTFFSNNMRVLAPFITFAVYALIPTSIKPRLTPASAFTTLSLIGMLSNPVSALLRAIPMLKSALACFDRIQRFLDSPCYKCSALPGDGSRGIRENELSRESGTKITPLDETQSEAIVLGAVHRRAHVYLEPTILAVRNASFSWTADSPAVIDNITFSVRKSSFTFIIGPVGCGKSTLLKGILNETPFSTGYCTNYSTGISFVAQTPWIQNVSIRQNIIGASQLDGSWYSKVVQVCALEHDIAGFSDSHDTVVGSRGISLSGGQKQRVALARALYAKKELMIIDDGFSGLDAETEEAMFSELMSKNGLLKQAGTTVILVTNAVGRLSLADHIICLDAAGSVTEQGKFDQLQSSGGYVQSLLIREKSEYRPKVIAKQTRSIDNEAGQISLARNVDIDDVDLDRQIGEWSTYKYYFASIGWLRSIISLSYLVISGVAVKLTELLITYWASAVSDHGDVANPFYLGLYGMLSGIGTIFWNIATYHYFLYVVPGSAERLHAKLLNSVINAPLYFFTNTDTGVTTNRFSQDMSAIDKELPFALIDLIVAVVQTLVGAILMCLATGYFASALPVVILILWVIQKFYLRTSRQIRLLDLEAKSPLYTHFIECLSGLATIRAFGWSNPFVERAMILLDNSQKPYYLLFCIQRWLSIVLDLMVAILAVLLMVLVVELRESVQPGYVGLALLNVLSFSSSLIWIVKQWTALETSIGAVSRLKKFTATTPDENCQGESERVSDAWPTKGAIEFRITSASYHPSGNLVLQDINLSIKAGERIGVCGRSGSGKSSLIMALFRLLEISPSSSITVDGVDITKIPRQIVRSRLNGIPQDSFMMKGSVRLNASPELRHSDLEIIEALCRVDLWSLIDSKGGLDAEVDREFFSHGQRQLFCLARSILRKSRIIALDEVSSSIDVATDKFIQQVIRQEFASATIISVAHRLDTIMDFDKIAVLKDGRLVEFEAPRVLLALPSAFRELYNSRGDSSHALL